MLTTDVAEGGLPNYAAPSARSLGSLLVALAGRLASPVVREAIWLLPVEVRCYMFVFGMSRTKRSM